MKGEICYLDNAATSFPKPRSVILGVSDCLSNYCGNAGRGSHRLALLAAQKIYQCREEICSLVGADAAENVVFVPSCTYGLNLLIKGILKQGDHVLISDMEHNSVYRPIKKLADEGKITYDIFNFLSTEDKSPEALGSEIEHRIKPRTRLIICAHQSNICSLSVPVDKIGEICRKNHILFALDTAQSIGHAPIDMQKMNIDFLVAPSHKGLYGPQGCGFVVFNSKEILDTLVEGGSGINSLDGEMPRDIPDRFEAGTLPLPSIAGLYEGIREVRSLGIDTISSHERGLFRALRDGLMTIRGATVYMPEHEGNTLLFNIGDIPCTEVGALLDARGICVRSGFHCAALAHRSLGTEKRGAVRASFGIFNSRRDVERLLTACREISIR